MGNLEVFLKLLLKSYFSSERLIHETKKELDVLNKRLENRSYLKAYDISCTDENGIAGSGINEKYTRPYSMDDDFVNMLDNEKKLDFYRDFHCYLDKRLKIKEKIYCLTDEEKEMLFQVYKHNETYEEMAKRSKKSKQYIHRRLKEIVSKMFDLM